MNDTPLPSPRPGSSPILTPEEIICGTDGKYRWVTQTTLPFRGRSCTLFTMDEGCVSSRRVKGHATREEVIHAFAVWVGGQSQPAQRFHTPKQVELSAVRHILACPDTGRIVLRYGLHGLALKTAPNQFRIILDWLTQHTAATVTTK